MTGAVPFGGPPAARGTVYLVGAGPGDPGLVSLRGAQLLSTATVVAFDRLAPGELLGLCRSGCETVYVGKRPDRHALSQAEINALLVQRAGAGEAVVRLKGGDPFVFGRGGEEAQACAAAGIAFEVVPGVTSATAVPAYAGIPVTHRGVASGVAVVTGHEDPDKPADQVDYDALARFPGTVVLLMGVGQLAAIADALIAAGKEPQTPAAVISWGTTPRQHTVSAPLAGIAEAVAAAGLAPPAVTLVGGVAALRDELAWFDNRPLHGVTVLVPRTRHQASALSERLRALGAEPVEAPTIAIEPTAEPDALRAALNRLADNAWRWLVFTSANGVKAVWEQLRELGGDARRFAGTRVAAVGPGTAEALNEVGLHPDLLPPRFTTQGLAEALVAVARTSGPEERSVLLPRADIATPTLARLLQDADWQVEEVEAYRTVRPAGFPPGVGERLARGDIDVLAFASSSTVRNFVELLGGLPDEATRVASIGPVTSQTCRELGLRVDAEADPHDLDGLTAAVLSATGRA